MRRFVVWAKKAAGIIRYCAIWYCGARVTRVTNFKKFVMRGHETVENNIRGKIYIIREVTGKVIVWSGSKEGSVKRQ